MLPQRVRLTQSYLFEKAMRTGFKPRLFVVPHGVPKEAAPQSRVAFLLCALPQTSKNPHASCRFGIIVSKKTDKRAVIRNRIRRKLREAIRTALPQWTQEGLHRWVGVVVIVGHKEAYTMPSSALQAQLNPLIAKTLQRFKASSSKA